MGGGSLTSAQNAALSSLNASMQGIRTTSHNMANLSTDGYSKKVFTQTAQPASLGGGVKFSHPKRVSDVQLVANVQGESAKLSGWEAKYLYLNKLEQLFGNPNADSGFSKQFTKLAVSMQSLSVNPSNISLQRNVVYEASRLSQNINDASNGVQKLRGEIDNEIGNIVTTINAELSNLSQINQSIISGNSKGYDVSDLQDERDNSVSRIGDMIGVQTFFDNNGGLNLFTADGSTLLGHIQHNLSYNSVALMGPNITYPTNIQGIMLGGYDITTTISSGKMKSLIDLRDTILPAHQAELDMLTKTLSDKVNTIHNLGTGLPPPSVLTGTKSVALTDSFSGSGNIRISFVNDTGEFTDLPVQIDLSTVTTVTDLIDAINTETGSATAFITSKQTLGLRAPGGSCIALTVMGGVPAIETITNKGFSHYFGLNDFFVSSPVTAILPDVGIANTLSVRSDIVQTPGFLSRATANASTDVSLTGTLAQQTGVPQLANDIMLQLSQALEATDIVFASAGNINVHTGSFLNYISSILTTVSADTSQSVQEITTNQSTIDSLKANLSSINGVSEEEELSNLILYQQSYRASAKIIQVLEDMLFTAIDIIRVR